MYFPREPHVSLLDTYTPSRAEVYRILQEVRSLGPPPTPIATSDSHMGGSEKGVGCSDDRGPARHILSNGMSVAEFCMWYIASGRTSQNPKKRKEK